MIGFDFGTTNSGMARVTDGALTAFPIDPYNALNPAVCRTAIYITKRFDIFTGSRAIDRYFADNLGRPVKFQRVRVGEITQTFADVGSFVKDVEIDIDIYDPGRLFVSFKSALAEREYDGTNVNGYRFALQDLIATYMLSLRYQLEALTGEAQTRVVLGRPVHFVGSDGDAGDQLAQARLASAAHRAGFSDVYFQYEPVAAAYSYAVTVEQPQTVFVFDFGGGTLDTTVMRIERGGRTHLLGIGGVALGGDRIDAKIVQSILPKHLGRTMPASNCPPSCTNRCPTGAARSNWRRARISRCWRPPSASIHPNGRSGRCWN
ncbi:MAG: Hsp70 family protein [Chloroflexota bacterium]|nr:Hsp70 family protein [Chloroflexota bacterium]